MLLRASRIAARAARSAVSATPHRAAWANSGADAAAPDLLLRRSPITSPSFGRCLSSHVAGSSTVESNPSTCKESGRVEFVADDKDLESDEALWDLYERWCNAYGEERSRDEMQRRFDYFKDSVMFVDRENKKAIRDGGLCSVGLNKFADGKLGEQLVGGVLPPSQNRKK
ncbi:unnamed protein product [Urochloa humidicola]